MIPNLDLMLGTIERALEVAILPNATNASAREEASLALLFTRWIRDVVDDVGDAERASLRDCREAEGEVTKLLDADPVGRRVLAATAGGDAPRASEREAARRIRVGLGRMLKALRADGADALACELRARLYDLGVREIDRERSFGRATRLDPDWQSIRTLSELSGKESK